MNDTPAGGSVSPDSAGEPEATADDAVFETTDAESSATTEVAPEREEPAPESEEPDVEAGVEPQSAVPVSVEAAGGAGEQIEWQPIVDGDKIEWQPVMAEDQHGEAVWAEEGEPSWPGGEAEAEAEETQWEAAAYASEPEFDYPEDAPDDAGVEWEAAAVPPSGSPIAANGAVRARPSVSRPRSRARQASTRRPPGSRTPQGRPERDTGDRPASVKRQVIVLSVLTALVLGIGAAAFLISRDATEKGEEAQDGTTTPPASTTVSTLPESALQTFTDEQTGFSLKYSKTWERLVPPVSDIRLVVNAGGNDGFQVRVAPIQTPATTENIGNFKAVTDAVVLGDQSARLLQEQLVTVNGLLTYYYLYSFQDPLTNTEGVHAHYFIFEGNRMFMLNFQTVPIEEFRQQAGLFDQIAESFTVQPRPNTTAAPAPTTVP